MNSDADRETDAAKAQELIALNGLDNTAHKPNDTLEGDKEELKSGHEWTGLEIREREEAERANWAREDHESTRVPRNGFFSPQDAPADGFQLPEPTAIEEAGPPLPEKDDPDQQPTILQSSKPRSIHSSSITNGTTVPPMQRSETSSSAFANGSRKSSTMSSMLFVTTALENIAASKEARKRKGLGDSVQTALNTIKQDATPDPEIIFEPLRLATETSNIPLTTTALDCIGKLISYSYFSMPTNSPDPSKISEQPQISLIERAIDTICFCGQDEATPPEIQLQIVKSLLAAVLNDKIIVHGAGLLKAVRQIYNIFLVSKSNANQQVAQGTLTQMIGTVFERVTARLAMKEARGSLSKVPSEKGTANGSLVDLIVDQGTSDQTENESVTEHDGSPKAASTFSSDQPVDKESGEKLTLQSFENAKNFDDTRFGEDHPTMVTRAKTTTKGPRTASGRQQTLLNSNSDEHPEHDYSDDDEEDEIYVKDAFLVFRSMCRLSIKTLPQEQQQDLRSQSMRSKLMSLAIIRTILNNNMDIFTSPLVIIRSSVNNEPASFGQAINQYLRLALSRNGASSVRQVFEMSCEIFWLMLKDMRVMLKREIEVFLKEIYLTILDRRNAPGFQKLYIMRVFRRLSSDPKALVELYLNYDCDRTALDNMFQRTIEHLSRMSSTSIAVSAQQQQMFQDHYSKETDVDIDWHDHGKLPPSLTSATLLGASASDSELPVDFLLKQQSLDCLVRTLRSLVNWSQETLASSTAKLRELEVDTSFDETRRSMDPGHPSNSPRPSALDTPLGPSTPLLEDDPSQLEKAKQRKTALINGIRQFNFKPKRGIKQLIKDGFIKDEGPEEIATFIVQNDRLDKAMIGEYLGEGEPQNVAIMHAFVDSMEFSKRRFVDALRQFLQSFRLPGEAQKIDRFMLKFAERYITGNPNAFANADTAYVLAYSVILLNTDLHSSKMKGRRMTKEDFIKNNRGINDSADLPDDYLSSIYDEIAHNEIVLRTERENAAALGLPVQGNSIGIASRAGQVLFTRDLEREAAHQADQEMSSKAEQRLRTLIKAQKKMALKPGSARYIPATSFKHVGPMFNVTWMSFLSGLSGQMQNAVNLDTIKMCMEGIKLAIRIACLFDLETPRVAFVTALANFTNLGNLRDMMPKNLEALKALLEVAQTEGNMLKGSWSDILTCISQLDRFQLISGGVDEDFVPDVRKASILQPSRAPLGPARRSTQAARRNRPPSTTTSSYYQSEVVSESRSTDMIKNVDRIFTSTAELSGEAIIDFVRALSEVSWQEIQSSGQSESPRTYSLQKLVEISYYNMTRVRFQWTNIWQVLGEHFNQVGCHSNSNVVFFALDSLRQLSMRFMEIEELPGFKFQKDFLKPFEHVMANSSAITVKDMVLRCLIQMIQARGDNIRSGWKTMFGVFTVAAREPYEALVNLAFENVTQVYNSRFGVVISQGAFADLVVCLTEFSKNLKFQKKSLQAIETLKSTVPRMLKTPECPLSHRTDGLGHAGQHENAAAARHASRQTQEEQFWFPVLFAFHDVLMTGDDLEVRSQALNYLFDTLIRYGGDFPPEFWDILWRQLLYPIFMVLKSKSEMTKVLNHEDLSVWLSTTMIQALRNMIALFTHYFESLEYMLDRFLDLLALCICQESDTIARIGSNCLQTLILQNVSKFQLEHWHQIVSAFVELFDRTTAWQLFTAATSSSNTSFISEDDGTRRSSVVEIEGLQMHTSSNEEKQSDSPTNKATNGSIFPIADSDQVDETGSVNRSESTPDPHSSATAAELEDYRPQTGPQQQPVVVTAARRRFFNKIITRCVLQLLMIDTVNELFSNNDVYNQIPSPELLRLMALLKKSYSFAKKFNNDKELRMRLWREGFMKQPPNLLKQESSSASFYVSILVRMYFDETEERRRSRADTEAALIPLCADIIHSYVILDEETQQRNIVAWRPVVVDVMEGYTNFPRHDFEKHVETFYPLAVELLNRDMGTEVRLALQGLLRRIGEVRMGMEPMQTPVQTPTSPRSVSSQYFMRRSSRGTNR